jgi:hypothetical protein
MEHQFAGPLSWRLVGNEKACRLLLRNNSEATLTEIKVSDASPTGSTFQYSDRPEVWFDLLEALPPHTELPLSHRVMLEDFWYHDYMETKPGNEWLVRLAEEYCERHHEDILVRFLVDGLPSSQLLRTGLGSGLHLLPE